VSRFIAAFPLALLVVVAAQAPAHAAVVPLPRVSAETSAMSYRGKPVLRVRSVLVRKIHGKLRVSCNRCRRLKSTIRITRPTSTSKRFTKVNWLLGSGRVIRVAVTRRGWTGRFLLLSARTRGGRRGLVFSTSGCLDRRGNRVRCPRGVPQPVTGSPVPPTPTPPPTPSPATPAVPKPRPDTPGVVRAGQWFLSQTFAGTTARTFSYGNPGDIPLLGDWNGDGIDTPGVVRGGRWFLSDTFAATIEHDFLYGNPGDIALAGDWNGDGKDTPGVVRGGRWFLSDTFAATIEHDFGYGNPGDIALAGDWNGDGKDTPGVVRGGRWFLSDTFAATVEHDFGYGNPGDVALAGFTAP
jgi:hypothetical protein